MYYATGLPGWMRFGYSPGWVGRSPTGLPPTAEWLMVSGLVPQYREYLRTQALTSPTAVPSTAPTPSLGIPVTKEQERQMLEHQVKAIESQLDATKRKLEKLRESTSTRQQQ